MAREPRRCPECGQPQIRAHRHADPEARERIAANVRYGRQVAYLERQHIRRLVKAAQERITGL